MDDSTKNEIEKIARKILREAGIKDPPIKEEHLLSHLDLHRNYYDLTDPSLLDEVQHKLRIGAERVVSVLRKVKLLAALIPEDKRIFIDKSLHDRQKRWATLHEAAHSVLPWHKTYFGFGDTAETLAESFHERLEHEANYGASQILFCGDMFKHHIAEEKPSFDAVEKLVPPYDTSWESTLRKYVETSVDTPMFLLAFPPPWDDKNKYFQRGWHYFVRSTMQNSLFPTVGPREILRVVELSEVSGNVGREKDVEFELTDVAGNRTEFIATVFYSGFKYFVLVTLKKRILSSILLTRKVI